MVVSCASRMGPLRDESGSHRWAGSTSAAVCLQAQSINVGNTQR